MFQEKKILAVITARKGSKRLVNKNILEINGKPLIAWTIEEALKSKYLDKVIVSTNCDKIAEISQQFKAEIPFSRPSELSNDSASSIAVLNHAIDFYKDKYDYIMLLQPTSPLRLVLDIDMAIEKLGPNARSIVSVTPSDHSPLWANTLPEDLSMRHFIKEEVKGKRSQDLPQYYRLNGAVYVAEIAYFKEKKGFFGELTKAYIMPKNRSIDIDDEFDFRMVSFFMNEK